MLLLLLIPHIVLVIRNCTKISVCLCTGSHELALKSDDQLQDLQAGQDVERQGAVTAGLPLVS